MTRIEGISPGSIASIACLLEATARKPGNVHRFRDFDDATYLDFALSASAITGPLDRAGANGVGRAILEAVEATSRVVAHNTNLGMILLLAPLAAVGPEAPIREGLAEILGGLTVEDARLAYQAIRTAHPGGLGRSSDQDISDEPTATLLEAMTLAADRDQVARQYATGYADVFDAILPDLRASIAAGRAVETAIVGAFLRFLAGHPDSLIARKRGHEVAREASDHAREVTEAGWPDGPAGAVAFEALDAWLRGDGHARNPGATADLVTAGLFLGVRDGTIRLPVGGVWSAPWIDPPGPPQDRPERARPNL